MMYSLLKSLFLYLELQGALQGPLHLMLTYHDALARPNQLLLHHLVFPLTNVTENKSKCHCWRYCDINFSIVFEANLYGKGYS